MHHLIFTVSKSLKLLAFGVLYDTIFALFADGTKGESTFLGHEVRGKHENIINILRNPHKVLAFSACLRYTDKNVSEKVWSNRLVVFACRLRCT